jgi:hypothetical protein
MNLDYEPITEYLMFPGDFGRDELEQTVLLLAERMKVSIVRTNNNKHQRMQVELVED